MFTHNDDIDEEIESDNEKEERDYGEVSVAEGRRVQCSALKADC